MQAPAQIYTLQKPKQARSRARRAALIECGVEFLNERELDEFSVAEVTHRLGYSTGSFYSYFPDKTAFFIAVQEWVNEDQAVIETDRDALINKLLWPEDPREIKKTGFKSVFFIDDANKRSGSQ